MSGHYAQLPATSQVGDKATARFLDAAKQTVETLVGVRGNPLDRAVTFRALAGALPLDLGHGAPVVGPPVPPWPTGPAPTKLSDLEANGAFDTMILTWSGAAQVNYGHTEIWRSSTDNLGTAVLVGTAIAPVYADPVGPGKTEYYWVRAVSRGGVAGPYNATVGTKGVTETATATILADLQGAITTSQLAASLNTTIGLIGNLGSNITADPNFTYGGRFWTASPTPATPPVPFSGGTPRSGNGVDGGKTLVLTGERELFSTKLAPVDPTHVYKGQIRVRQTVDDAGQSCVYAGFACYDAAGALLVGNGGTYGYFIASAKQLLVSDGWKVYSGEISGTGTTTAQFPPGTANVRAMFIVNYQGGVGSAEVDVVSIWDATDASKNYALVQTQAESIAGLLAQYTVKTDVNGYVAGYGLATTTNDDGTQTSEFVVNAATFGVTFPSEPWAASTAHNVGDYLTPSSAYTGTLAKLIYKVTTASGNKESGTSEPIWPTSAGASVTDNNLIYTAVSPTQRVPFVIGEDGAGNATVGIDGALVVKGTIGADRIAVHSIAADKLDVANLAAVAATLGTVTGGTFQTNASPATRVAISNAGGFPIWAGTGDESVANAAFCMDTSGNATFAGKITASTIQLSKLLPNSLKIDCGDGRFATWVAVGQNNKIFPNGFGPADITIGEFHAPTYGSGFDAQRLIFATMDCHVEYAVHGDHGKVTLSIEAQYDGGAWEVFESLTQDCNYRGTISGSLTYTTKNTGWGSVAFRLVTDKNTQSITGRVLVLNLVESSRTPDSVTDTTSDTTATLPVESPPVYGPQPTGQGPGDHRPTLLLPALGGLTQAGMQNATADWMAESSTRKWAGQSGADVTGDHTSADTAHVSGVIASAIRAGAQKTILWDGSVVPPQTNGLVSSISGSSYSSHVGSNMLSFTGQAKWYPESSALYPYDPGKLYHIKVGISPRAPAGNITYLGIRPFDVSGNALGPDGSGNWYVLANSVALSEEYHEFEAWITGASGAGANNSLTPADPGIAPSGSAGFSPVVLCNYGQSSSFITYLDYFSIDVYDLEATRRTYRGFNTGGRLNSQKNIPPIVGANLATGYWSSRPAISSSYVAGSASVQVSACTYRLGSQSVSYAASSASGLTPGAEYDLVFQDPTFAGGAPDMYLVSHGSYDIFNNDANLYVISFETASAGGGGAPVPPSFCLHAQQPVLTRCGERPAGVLEVGAEVKRPDGTWTPILSVERKPHEKWLRIATEAGTATVTYTQPYMLADGRWQQAQTLTIGSPLHLGLHVGAIEAWQDSNEKIIIGIAPPHAFLLTAAGPVVHNGLAKPS